MCSERSVKVFQKCELIIEFLIFMQILKIACLSISKYQLQKTIKRCQHVAFIRLFAVYIVSTVSLLENKENPKITRENVYKVFRSLI